MQEIRVYGNGLNLALLKDEYCEDPIFESFFLRYIIIIAHEINIKNKISNVRYFNIIFTLKTNHIFEELPKYIMQYGAVAWESK